MYWFYSTAKQLDAATT
nr:hypothetical protein [Haloarchaeobius iranensis]